MSCGNRNCPKFQSHNTTQWIDRQQQKLLPVEYFMVTFTLPFELRRLAFLNQREIYTLFFNCVATTLKDFGLNPKHLGAEIGMTMVLHTNNRKLDYHPHIHVVIPGGGIDKARRQWKKKKGKYLFNHKALATVFRARFIDALNSGGFSIPPYAPQRIPETQRLWLSPLQIKTTAGFGATSAICPYSGNRPASQTGF